MNVFISQPMGGKTEEEINRERDKAIQNIKNVFGEDVNILDTNFNFSGKSSLYYLAKSIEMLDQANAAYFMKNWWNYRGCLVEHMCCVHYGIPRLYESVL